MYLLPSVLSLIRGLACSKLSAHLALVLSHNDVPFSAVEHLSRDKASVATVLPAPSAMLPNPFRVLELAFFQLDDLSTQFDTKLWRGVTYIITPPDRGVVGAAYSATVSRARAILWLSLDIS